MRPYWHNLRDLTPDRDVHVSPSVVLATLLIVVLAALVGCVKVW